MGSRPEMRQRIYFANHASSRHAADLVGAAPCVARVDASDRRGDYWGRGAVRRHIGLKVLNGVLVERSTQGPARSGSRTLAQRALRG